MLSSLRESARNDRFPAMVELHYGRRVDHGSGVTP